MPARPTLSRHFYKAHGLGNDYLVFDEGSDWTAGIDAVEAVCDRFRGPGGDGIVAVLADRGDGVHRLRMFNPDGSEFERSGNGLRVLASFLHRAGRVGGDPFTVEVGGDRIEMTVHARDGHSYDVSVEMGRATVGPEAVAMAEGTVEDGRMNGPDGEALTVVPVGVGNPHVVVWDQPLTTERLQRVGPFLTRHPSLANGTNVQLAAVEGPGISRCLIWERGVGPTSASGTSACAVAVASVHRGLHPPGVVTVVSEGGRMAVTVSETLDVVLRAPVEEVMEGALTQDFAAALPRS